MAWWNRVSERTRVGVGNVAASLDAGARGLRDASAVLAAQRAGRRPEGPEAPTDADADGDRFPDLQLSVAEAVLLVRYIGGRAALAQVQPFGLGKYVLLALAVVFFVLSDVPRGFAVLWLVVFALAALLQWRVSRTIRRFGLLDELSGIELAADQAREAWWPNLKAELARVGLPTGPFALLRLGGAHLRRRPPPDQRAALARVDWRNVLPHAQWVEARALLAEQARRSPPPDATT